MIPFSPSGAARPGWRRTVVISPHKNVGAEEKSRRKCQGMHYRPEEPECRNAPGSTTLRERCLTA